MLPKAVINHGDYNKITDDVYLMDLNVVLRMSVALYSNKGEYRSGYHKEFGYYDKNAGKQMYSIRRMYDYFLSIENVKSVDGYKEFIRIGNSEIMLVRRSINGAIQWFNNPEYSNLFCKSRGKLIVGQKVDPISIADLPMGKYLVFEPTVVEYNDNRIPGVRMYLSSTDNFCDMPINRFMGFAQIIFDINIFMCAQNMLNYLQRPEFGTNLFTFNTREEDLSPGSGAIDGRTMRQIPVNSNKSIFDKLG